MLLQSLIKGLKIKNIKGERTIPIRGITYDSRKIKNNFIFTALPGFHTDGHQHIEQAVKNGASVIIHEKEIDTFIHGITYIQVEKIRSVLSAVSAAFFNHPSHNLGVIGVTGTDGKSTTVWFIDQLLNALGEKSGFLSTVQIKTGGTIINNPFRQSTPEAPEIQEVLYQIRESGNDFAVLEATSHGLSDRTARLADVDFDIAVLTNVTHEHLEFHGSFEQYRSDKANLFRLLDKKNPRKTIKNLRLPGYGIINSDDPSCAYFSSMTQKKTFTYSIKNKAADLFADSLLLSPSGTTFTIIEGLYKKDTRLNIPGAFNIENLLAASLAVCKLLNVHISDLVPFFQKLLPVRGRMTTIDEGQRFKVIVDYAHTPSSFKKIMPMMRHLTKGKLISVFGSAGERDKEKRPMQGSIASTYSDIVILTDEDPRLEESLTILEEIAQGCTKLERGKTLFLEPDRTKAIALAYTFAKEESDTVLLLGKGHETSIIYPDKPIKWDEIMIAGKLLRER
ncbi:MAG: UDP-N-acetylmuramoyl-L-alanyl-D-glutamate--2,6-diaminopimelate ligase [Spirochaetales bacterium]|nr:UDP-N-acetylmuramoyl-L-alanyl-D-glutamate--2,6-diaminopimelate ligase [Spirochaetales bacterium]